LIRLERQLLTGSYRPGRYVTIEVHDPKHRLVSAAPFRPRRASRALRSDRADLRGGFINHLFANRKEKGAHRAITSTLATGTGTPMQASHS